MKRLREYLEEVLPQRLWQRLFAFFVFLVVIPLIILGMLLIQTSQQAVRTTVFRDNEQIAVRAAKEIEQFINGPKKILKTTAAILGVLQDDSWRQETAIVELGLQQPIFRRVSLLDITGREVTSSQLGTALRDRSSTVAFQKAMAGEDYISSVTFGPEHIPEVTMATSVNKFHKVVGVLFAEVNLRGAWDIVDRIQIGTSGTAGVVSSDGQWISNPDKKIVLNDVDPFSKNIARNVLLGKPGSWEQTDSRKEHWLISYAPVPGLGWGLIIAQPTSEAYAFSKVMRRQAWSLIGLSIFATVLISLLASQLISHPISELVKGTRQVSTGDFDCRLSVKSKDEIGELLEAFNTMTTRLKDVQRIEKLSIIGRAATTIAHELKNSLTLVDTYIQSLPQRCKDRKFIEIFSQVVPQELDSWKGMLKNMTDYAQDSQFPVESVDINHLLQELVAVFRERAIHQGIQFVSHNGAVLPLIRGHREKLKQVFLNLLSNAFEATPSGGTISLSVGYIDRTDEDAIPHIKIQVTDTGKGIPLAEQKKIFDPFYTTRVNGLGLGLSISKDIVEHHGGRIEVASEINRGTVFTVRLPVREV